MPQIRARIRIHVNQLNLSLVQKYISLQLNQVPAGRYTHMVLRLDVISILK